MAKGAQSVKAHDIPTMPMMAVAPPMDRTRSVLNMQAAKMQWERSQARRRVSQGMTSLARKREVRVVYDFWDAREETEGWS